MKKSKTKIFRVIRTLFEQQDGYYKQVRGGNFRNNNYIKYESTADRNRNLSVKEYLNEMKPYLKDIIAISKNLAHWKFN